MNDPIVIEVRRGDTVESRHRVHAVAVKDGEVLASAGDPHLVTFLRSSAKPLQALPLARTREDLPADELAIACASHLARPEQVAPVNRMLDRVGATEDDLECGAVGDPPSRLNHNCSGKHAGMVAVCRDRGWPQQGYRLPQHQLQQRLLDELAAVSGIACVAHRHGHRRLWRRHLRAAARPDGRAPSPHSRPRRGRRGRGRHAGPPRAHSRPGAAGHRADADARRAGSPRVAPRASDVRCRARRHGCRAEGRRRRRAGPFGPALAAFLERLGLDLPQLAVRFGGKQSSARRSVSDPRSSAS